MATIDAKVMTVGSRRATIRTTEATDASGVLALRVASAEETDFLSCEPDEIRSTVEQQAEFLRTKSTSPVDLFILAEVEGRIAGLASLDGSKLRRFGHGATLGLVVAREFWRQGLGKALVASLLGWADSSGIVRVALEVVETNTGAIRLYESLGFEHEGRLRCRRRHGDVYLDNHMMSRIRHEAR